MGNDRLRELPPVHNLLEREPLKTWRQVYRHEWLRRLLDEVLAGLREDIARGRAPAGWRREDFCQAAVERLQAKIRLVEETGLRPVVNATGVVVHTNLGRSPLAAEALAAIRQTAGGYCNLEFDLETGQRGHRDTPLSWLAEQLWPGQAATAVNNGAAALFLILNTLGAGGEVVVSRGELVEIGGSFRIPEIMAKSGVRLVETGTTNRTRTADYAAALTPDTRLILQVHRSNFELVGFTETPPLAELAVLARQQGIPLVVDAGSGCLWKEEGRPITGEPAVDDLLAAGADLVSFSGDKLLGGPQAGLVVGRPALVEQLRRNPLMRILRLDKLVLASLCATLRLYFYRDRPGRLPLDRFLQESPAALRRRSRRLVGMLAVDFPAQAARCRIEPGHSLIGGGAAPRQHLPGWMIVIPADSGQAGRLAAFLRHQSPPVIGRLEQDRVVLDLRTVAKHEEALLLSAFREACRQGVWKVE